MQSTQFLEQILPFIQQHWQGFLALLIIAVLIIINEMISKKNRPKELSPQAMVELINNDEACVVDLRDANAFRAGHIIHALNVSMDDLDQKRLEKYKSKPIILVCAKGLQSSIAVAKLRTLKFENPMVLAGGLASWENAGLPLVKGKE